MQSEFELDKQTGAHRAAACSLQRGGADRGSRDRVPRFPPYEQLTLDSVKLEAAQSSMRVALLAHGVEVKPHPREGPKLPPPLGCY